MPAACAFFLAAGAAVSAAAAAVWSPPASYTGRIPCADCIGIDATVTFNADNTYAQRYVYVGARTPSSFVETGVWRLNTQTGRFTLTPAKGGPHYYQLGRNTLTALDANGAPIHSNLNFTLRKSKTPIELNVPAAAATPGAQKTATLEGPTWYLVVLGDQRVITTSNEATPRLHFDAGHLSGSTGCNRVAGEYVAKGDSLTFAPAATTRMMCEQGADLESRFLNMLPAVKSYTIDGDLLKLRDGSDAIATFKAAEK